jgi:hypothetical protein
VDPSFPSGLTQGILLSPFYDIQNLAIFFQKFNKISQINTRKSKNSKFFLKKNSEEKTLILLYAN